MIRTLSFRDPGPVLALGLLVSAALFPFPGRASGPAASPVPACTPAPAVPAAKPSGLPPPTPAEVKSLLKELQRAQHSELKALEHRQRFELKELKASQSAREKEWNAKEREARHAFFKAHPKGEDRRENVKDFRSRHEALMAIFTDERNQRLQEQEVHMKGLKEDQAEKLRQFQERLKNGERPPESLWPRIGQ